MNAPDDRARGAYLFALLAHTPFYCPACEGTHPLREHRDCRGRSNP